jgi:hypothetical protein
MVLYSDTDEEDSTHVLPPTPMKPWSKLGRGGGLDTAPVQIIYMDLTNE